MVRDKVSFIEKAKELHNGVYNYSKFEYIKSKVKSTITCRKHGDFQQSANKHLRLQGCPKCGKESAADKKIKSKEGKIYTILKEKGLVISSKNKKNHIRNKDKVILECIIHGDFVSTLDSITSKGSNCPQCTVDLRPYINNKMSDTFFKRKAKEKGMDKVYFYIIHLEGWGESFVKYGVTTNLKTRFTGKLPYDIEKVEFIMLDVEEALKLEEAHRGKDVFKYEPAFKFGGYTECATKDLVDCLKTPYSENDWADFSEFKD